MDICLLFLLIHSLADVVSLLGDYDQCYFKHTRAGFRMNTYFYFY